jgi:hypothetical protein
MQESYVDENPDVSAVHLIQGDSQTRHRAVDFNQLYSFSYHLCQKSLRGGGSCRSKSFTKRLERRLKSSLSNLADPQSLQNSFGATYSLERMDVRSWGRIFPLNGIHGLPMSTGQPHPSHIPRQNNVSQISAVPDVDQRIEPKSTRADGIRHVRAMLAAAATGNVDELERLMAAAAETGGSTIAAVAASCDPFWFGDTPLHYAALQGQVAAVEALVTRLGADVNRANSLGQTALHYAAAAGEADTCRRLILLGATTDLRCAGGRTPADDADLQGFDDAAAACSSRAAATAAAVAAAVASSGWAATRSTALSSSGGGGGGWRRSGARPAGEVRRRD